MIEVTKHPQWSERAERGLCKVLGDDRDSIVEGVTAGRLELWEVDGGKIWMVTCVEDGRELIVCCLQGRGLAKVAEILWRAIQQQGLQGARWFTQRPALGRALRRYPVKLLGHVYRVEVPRVAQ